VAPELTPESVPNAGQNKTAVAATRLGLSLDVWAVITALILAVMVRTGILKHIPW
jgi:hypothetical protein